MSSDDDSLTQDQRELGLRKMTWQGITSQVRMTLTESVFLVGFAVVVLNAPNTLIGILAAIPFLAQLLQIPSVYIIHRAGKRKIVNVVTQLGNRMAILGMALIPFLSVSDVRLVLLVVFVAIQAIFNAIGSPSWNSWLRDLVPIDRLGRFFSVRMAATGVVAIIVALLGGQFIGLWTEAYSQDPSIGYSILFFVAFVFGMIAVYFTSTTPEPKLIVPDRAVKFSQIVEEPFKDDNFRQLIWFSVVWTFSTALASPFFTVYLLNRAGLDLPAITILVAVTQLVSIAFFRFWGRLSDRFSNKSILQVSSPLFIISTVMWTFTAVADFYSLKIPLLILIHVVSGFSSAGVNLATSNIGLKLAPRGEATSYLASRGSVMAVAGTAAPLIGGAAADVFTEYGFRLDLTFEFPGGIFSNFPAYDITGLDFVFIISAIIGFYSLYRLSRVKETGEVDEHIVIDAIMEETRRNVRTLSTVDGLRHTFHIPVSEDSDSMRKRRKKRNLIQKKTDPELKQTSEHLEDKDHSQGM
ncbi:MAG: MFS transporter [Candidatus Thorarchaeota archaeon]|nr:MAG: MFS transporter [Candidatus Thorarchaeota archaeon]